MLSYRHNPLCRDLHLATQIEPFNPTGQDKGFTFEFLGD